MKIKKYVGDLLGGNLFITESRIIAESLLKNLPYEEWKLLIVEENILQKKATRTSVRYAQAIRLRFSSLGLDFMADLLAADERAYTQMLMMALLINSPIVADFMKFSLAEARRTKKTNLNSDVWAKFYIAQSKVYDDLNKYSHKTI
ncbi:MAG: BrxA family protein, partial [Enterovibrio sp.]